MAAGSGINISNNTGTIGVEFTNFYTIDGVTISPTIYYFNKGSVVVTWQGNNVVIEDDNQSFSILYSDITSPFGSSAAQIANIIQGYIT